MNTDEIIADVKDAIQRIADVSHSPNLGNTVIFPRPAWIAFAARLIIDDRKQKWKRICWTLALANVLVWGWVAL